MNLTPRKDELRESPFNPRVMNGEALEIESWNSCNSPFRSGYSLIEMLVYISVLAVLMGVGYAAVYRSMDNSVALRRNAEDITRALSVGEIWRADVRNSGSTVRLENASSEPILHLRKSGKEISYRFAEQTVFRRTGKSGWTPLLRNVKSCEFVSESRAVRVWRWELELLPQRKKLNHTRPLFTFIAAPSAVDPQ
jgi:prepilin-type N-terminal cleavage/methylation domain